jgi:UDP-N-acetylmuramoyl-tripeptide--D-alanyl-D-alanine ligase
MMTIPEMIKTVRGRCLQDGRAKKIRRVVTDSRQVKRGDLFIAIKGRRLDGHRYVEQAIQQGAAAVIVSDPVAKAGAWIIKVKDTTAALGDLARTHRRRFDIPVIAVTGSTGKTTTKEMIASVLKRRRRILKNLKTENNQYGVPMTLLQIRPRHEAVVVELGTNHFGEMKYLTRIAGPTVAVMTNIGASHLEFLKNPSGVFREKFNIVRYTDPSGTVVFNGDDAYLKKIKHRALRQRKISYGLNGPGLRARDIQAVSAQSTAFFVDQQKFVLHSFAAHNIYNALAAVAVGKILKMPLSEIAEGLERWRPLKGRHHVIRTADLLILDDTYNANPVSFQSALETFARMKTKGRKILVCGDMKELGDASVRLHQRIGRVAAGMGVDAVFSVGKHAACLATEAARCNPTIALRHSGTVEELQRHLNGFIRASDAVLVKGSRAMNMEAIVDFLKNRKGS